MGVKQRRKWCRSCGQYTLHSKETVDRVKWLLVTIFTGTLFFPVWLVIEFMAMFAAYRCQTCGKAKGVL